MPVNLDLYPDRRTHDRLLVLIAAHGRVDIPFPCDVGRASEIALDLTRAWSRTVAAEPLGGGRWRLRRIGG